MNIEETCKELGVPTAMEAIGEIYDEPFIAERVGYSAALEVTLPLIQEAREENERLRGLLKEAYELISIVGTERFDEVRLSFWNDWSKWLCEYDVIMGNTAITPEMPCETTKIKTWEGENK